MTKQEYNIYLNTRNWGELIYQYHLDVGQIKVTKQDVINVINYWNTLEINYGEIFNEPFFNFNDFKAYIIRHFNNKFERVTIYNQEGKIIAIQ
jgi:hypothetical protein